MALYERLSFDTAYQRFFTWRKKPPPALARHSSSSRDAVSFFGDASGSELALHL